MTSASGNKRIENERAARDNDRTGGWCAPTYDEVIGIGSVDADDDTELDRGDVDISYCACGQDAGKGHNQSLHNKIFPGDVTRRPKIEQSDYLDLPSFSIRRGGVRYPKFNPTIGITTIIARRHWWQLRARKQYFVHFALDTTFPCAVPGIYPVNFDLTLGPFADYVTAREAKSVLYTLHAKLYNTYSPNV